jgi:hypothetical protein
MDIESKWNARIHQQQRQQYQCSSDLDIGNDDSRSSLATDDPITGIVPRKRQAIGTWIGIAQPERGMPFGNTSGIHSSLMVMIKPDPEAGNGLQSLFECPSLLDSYRAGMRVFAFEQLEYVQNMQPCCL